MILEVRRSGEKRESREEGEPVGKYHLVERSFGCFRRSFTLPRTGHCHGPHERHGGPSELRHFIPVDPPGGDAVPVRLPLH